MKKMFFAASLLVSISLAPAVRAEEESSAASAAPTSVRRARAVSAPILRAVRNPVRLQGEAARAEEPGTAPEVPEPIESADDLKLPRSPVEARSVPSSGNEGPAALRARMRNVPRGARSAEGPSPVKRRRLDDLSRTPVKPLRAR